MAQSLPKRQFQVLQQSVNLSFIDIANCRILASTELKISPLNDVVQEITLNASHLHVVKVYIKEHENDVNSTFRYRNSLAAAFSNISGKDRGLPNYQHLLRRVLDECDADEAHGELTVSFDEPLASIIQKVNRSRAADTNAVAPALPENALTLVLEYVVADERCGVQFVHLAHQETPSSLGRHAIQLKHADDNHAFTSGPTRTWLPCIDAYSEPCFWTFNITCRVPTSAKVDGDNAVVPPYGSLVALAPGTLVSDVYDPALETRKFTYALNHPTAAPNIGWSVGPYVSQQIPAMPQFTFWCLRPHVEITHITGTYAQMPLTFFEDLLDFRLPMENYRFVFVHHSTRSITSYHGLTVLDSSLLFHHGVLEPQMESRIAIAEALAAQYFGSGCLSCLRWNDSAWLFEGIARYMTLQFIKAAFGINEYKYKLLSDVKKVNEYDRRVCAVILARRSAVVDDASSSSNSIASAAGAGDTISIDSSIDAASSSTKPRSDAVDADIIFGAEKSDDPKKKANVLLSKSEKQLLSGVFYNPWSPVGISEEYAQFRRIKAGLIIHHISDKLGPNSLFSVIKKALTLARPGFTDNTAPRNLRCYTTNSFFALVRDTHGRAIFPLVERWVFQGHNMRLKIRFHYQKRGNSIELTIEQRPVHGSASAAASNNKQHGTMFRGSIPVILQEIDGAVSHSINIDIAEKQTVELACSCKFRKLKRKKVILSDGQEADINLEKIRDECPVLWMRLDQEITVIHDIQLEMPDIIWQNMLLNEKCVIAQLRSIEALSNYASYDTARVLLRCVERTSNYYRVRQAAAEALVGVINKLVSEKKLEIPGGMLSLHHLYRQTFCVKVPNNSATLPVNNAVGNAGTSTEGAKARAAETFVIKSNDFRLDIGDYYLQCGLLPVMARLRDATNNCPQEIVRLLLDIWYYMDDTRNRMTSSYYKASCIEALVETISPAAMLALGYGDEEKPNIPVERLPKDVVDILSIVVRALNMDMTLPSHKFVITCTCFRSMVKLVRMRLMSCVLVGNVIIFGLNPVHFRAVRLTAIECWLELQNLDRKNQPQPLNMIEGVLSRDVIENVKEDPVFRATALSILSRHLDFGAGSSHHHHDSATAAVWARYNTTVMANFMWCLLTSSDFSCHPSLRSEAARLYYKLYRNRAPEVLLMPRKH